MKNMQHLLLLLLLCVPLLLAAQVPDWYDAASRRLHYPPEAWYTGFIVGEQHEGEKLEDACTRLKNEARAELVSTIRTTVEKNSSLHTQSDLQQNLGDMYEQINESYVSDTYIRSCITDIPGLNVDAWRKTDGTIAAFAYLKRNTLNNHLIKRITLNLAKAESAEEQAKSFMEENRKSEARKAVTKGLQHLHEVEEAQSLLAITDETADDETLQYSVSQTLQQRLGRLEQQLKNALMVYVECEADMFGKDYTALGGSIRDELSRIGVTFVALPEQSDMAVYVKAAAREYNSRSFGSVTSYTAYVEATISIEKTDTGQRVYEGQPESVKGTHTLSFAEAAREAYHSITPKICEIVIKQMQ